MRKQLATTGLAMVLAASLVGCGKSPIKIEGDFILNKVPKYAEIGEACAGERGYDDIQEGAQVTVRDSKGETVAALRLSKGLAFSTTNGNYPDACHFDIIGEVPDKGSDFYAFEVSHRGEVTVEPIEEDGVKVLKPFLSLG